MENGLLDEGASTSNTHHNSLVCNSNFRRVCRSVIGGLHLTKNSFLSGFLTMYASIVGSGLLALPYAFSLSGWCAGVCIIALGFLLNFYSCYLLLQYANKNNFYTLNSVADDAFYLSKSGKHYQKQLFRRFTEVMIILNNFGSIISYIIVVFLTQIETLVPLSLKHMGISNEILTSHYLWGVLLCVFVIFPLSHSSFISTLRYSALVSFFSSIYVAGLIIAKTSQSELHRTDIYVTRSASGQLRCFSIVLFAFTTQTNVGQIYEELGENLPPKEQERLRFSVLISSMSVSMLVYLVVGVLGSFLSDGSVDENILVDLHSGDVPSVIVRPNQGMLNMTVSLLCSIPLLLYPLVPLGFEMANKHIEWYGRKEKVILVAGKTYAVILFSAMAVALVSQNELNAVIGITGSLSCLYISIILPCATYIKDQPGHPSMWRVVFCSVVLVIMTCLCLGAFVAVVLG